MEEQNQVEAIAFIASLSPRLKNEIWAIPKKEIAVLTGLSHGENRLYEICVSIWNGGHKIDLYDTLCSLSESEVDQVVEALLIAKKGIAKTSQFRPTFDNRGRISWKDV